MKQKRLYAFLLAISSLIAAMEKNSEKKLKKCKKVLDN